MHRIGLFVYGVLSDAASFATFLFAIRLLSFGATPTMTAAHLLFALTTSPYILIAIRLEAARPEVA